MPRRRETSSGTLRDEDVQLWLEVTRSVMPLARRAPLAASCASEPDAEAVAAEAPPAQPVRVDRSQKIRQPTRHVPAPLDLRRGTISGLDRRSAERLRKGREPIEGRLDLHGLTEAQAHAALGGFIARAHNEGRRNVLIITGKGGDGQARGKGILRRSVPRWLDEQPNRARVLAFSSAQPQHGGEGALYVKIRRRRSQ